MAGLFKPPAGGQAGWLSFPLQMTVCTFLVSLSTHAAGRRLGARVAVEEIGVLDLFEDSFQMQFCMGKDRKSFSTRLAEEVLLAFLSFQIMMDELRLPSAFVRYGCAAGVASHTRRILRHIIFRPTDFW